MILDYIFLTVLLTLRRDFKKLFEIKNREKQEISPSIIAFFLGTVQKNKVFLSIGQAQILSKIKFLLI